MKRLTPILIAALAAAFACSKDSTAPDPDVIDGPEMAAVRTSLDSALKNDATYQVLRQIAFLFLDRASHVTDATGESRIAGIQLDIDATHADTQYVVKLTGYLAWRGYSPTTHTVDSVTFVIGSGLVPPISDSLRRSFSPDTAGQCIGFIIHEGTDSTVTAWSARVGVLNATSASYGSGQTLPGGTFTVYRGTMVGNYDISLARGVADTTSLNSAAASFSTGVRAVKVRITGVIP